MTTEVAAALQSLGAGSRAAQDAARAALAAQPGGSMPELIRSAVGMVSR